ncbi:ABC transporter substrate-binding protein [Alteribacillus iranensis]|uniref:Peptide/nickel transport system substrate-binding protein n=1 Tax=Alteribacillus iranensis TaxID=930128 RepID=A0A1I2BDT8_9BACI|nr:ABC transporter substrate-binding protein [Alteribacillus iranensis]SFE54266.1 peptide/nickel transport system substrate-binding protein [Alteribacillus iranensis]
MNCNSRVILITIAYLSIFLLIGCSTSGEQNDGEVEKSNSQTNSLVLAVGGEPDEGFDPTIGWGRYGSPLFQSTLLSRDRNMEIQMDLAASYHVSEDGKTWIVELRKDARFSDGESVTAQDVVFTFNQAANSASVVDLSHLQNVKAIDDFKVAFTLKEPRSTFVYSLLTIGIVPEHLYDTDYYEEPVGSGPYQMKEWRKGQQLIVEANPHYYGKKPEFERATFLFLEEDAALAAARAGEVDVVSVPPSFAGQDIAGMELVTLESVDNLGIMFPVVPEGKKTEKGVPIGHDVTADRAIRQAINIAIDRKDLVEGVLNGYGTPAYTVADHLPWWNEETEVQDGDIERAKDIMRSAGWRQGEEVFEKDGLEAKFTLYYPTEDQVRQSLAMAFAELISPLGIEVDTEGKSWNELERLMHSHPVLMGWGSHTPIEIYNLFSTSTQGEGYYNANYYSNPVVDDYMNKALRAATENEAIPYWQKAQWDGHTGFSAKGDAPWAWLVNVDHTYFVKEDLVIGDQKIQPHGHGWPITDFITEWHWED